jgi:thiol-disulfide isomerase/thioredoxin
MQKIKLSLYMPRSKKYVPKMISPGSLYGAKDPVVILGDADFIGGKMKGPAFSGPGILKAYASWCPHCKTAVECVCELGKACKDEGVNMTIYVIEAQENAQFAVEQGVDAFPSYYAVDRKGGLKRLASRTLADVVDEVCKPCRGKKSFTGRCFSNGAGQKGGGGPAYRAPLGILYDAKLGPKKAGASGTCKSTSGGDHIKYLLCLLTRGTGHSQWQETLEMIHDLEGAIRGLFMGFLQGRKSTVDKLAITLDTDATSFVTITGVSEEDVDFISDNIYKQRYNFPMDNYEQYGLMGKMVLYMGRFVKI